MQLALDPPAFPCPFCRSRTPMSIGGNEMFVHYRCAECWEIWTATRFKPIARSTHAAALRKRPVRPKTRVLPS